MAIAAIVAGYLFIFEFKQPEPAKIIPTLVKPFKANEITAIQISYNGTNNIRAIQNNGRWILEKPVRYPAMTEGPNALLETINKLQPLSFREAMDNASDFGFEPPRVLIRLEHNSGPITLELGDFTLLEDKLYARSPSKPGVFTIDKKFLNALPFTENYWRDRKLFHLENKRLDIDHIHIRSGPRQILLQQTSNNVWQVAQPTPVKRGDQTRVEQALVKLWNWNVITFVSDDPKVDLQRYGLQSPEAELVLSHGTNRLAAIQFGSSPTNQPSQVYARRLNHTNIVVIPKPWLEDLRSPVWAYCDHHLVDAFDPGPGSLSRIEVQSGDPFTLEQSTNGVWSITQPSTLPADGELILNFLGQLRSLKAIELEREVVGDFSIYGLEQPSGQYTLRRRGGTNAILSQISFGSPTGNDGGQLFTRRYDEEAVYIVSSADRQKLSTYAYQLRNREFWQFSSEDVFKISIVRGENSVELLRNIKGEWTRTDSKLSPESRDNIHTALTALGRLRVAAWTARGADKLATYDILQRKKSVSLEIKRNGKTFTRKVQFGKQSPSLNFYAYATDPLDQESVVFEFPLNTYNACEIILFPLLASKPLEQ